MSTIVRATARDRDAQTATGQARADQVRAANREHMFPCETRLYEQPLVIARAQGTTVWDVEGREYLDLFSGILTTSVGHCHPEVVERVQQQVATLGHTSTLYLTPNEVEAAQALASIAPGRLDRTFFTNSGTEAIETAVMLACMYTGPRR
jgi:4-aminobutyrate aminotransferase-like enzyme